jgi:hypothetical protein
VDADQPALHHQERGGGSRSSPNRRSSASKAARSTRPATPGPRSSSVLYDILVP